MNDSIFNELQDKANEVDAIGGTIKFVIDDTIVFVDGTGAKNLVSSSNEDADCTISTTATALKRYAKWRLKSNDCCNERKSQNKW